MHIRCWAELVQYGANDILKREYGSLMKGQAEPEYNVSLEINFEQVPAEGGPYAIHFFYHHLLTHHRGARSIHQINSPFQT
jgi:hypothetical protein